MPRVFVSYARADVERVDRIIKSLRDGGCDVWLDRHEIRSGDQWRQQIAANVRQSDAFVLILSNASTTSDNVRREVDIASDAGTKIVPIKIDDVAIPETLQYQLAGVHFIDYAGGSRSGLDELVRAAGGDPGSTPRGSTRPAPSLLRAGAFGLAVGGAVSLVVECSESIWSLLTRDLWAREVDVIRQISTHMPCNEEVPIVICSAAVLVAVAFRARWRPLAGGAVGAVAGLVLSIALQFSFIHGCDHLEEQVTRTASAASTPVPATERPVPPPPVGSRWADSILVSVKIIIAGLVVGVLVGLIGPLLRVVGWSSRLVG